MREAESIETLIIGAARRACRWATTSPVAARRSSSWRQTSASATAGGRRWDSLRLFTPARFDGLAGLPFPASSRLPHQGRDGRLPRGLRRALRAAGPHRRPGGPRLEAGRRGSWSRPASSASRPTTWSWRWPTTSSPGCPGFAGELDPGHRPAPFRATTATPASSGTAACWSWGRATRAPRSPWSWPGRAADLDVGPRHRPSALPVDGMAARLLLPVVFASSSTACSRWIRRSAGRRGRRSSRGEHR